MLAGFILFVIFATICGAVAKFMPSSFTTEDRYDGKKEHNTGTYKAVAGGVATIFVLLAALMVVISSLHFVPAGRAGLVTRFGAVTGRTIEPGPNLTWPFFEKVVLYDTRVQKVEFVDLDSASKELQDVKVTGILNYRINPEAVSWFHQNVGSREVLEDKVLIPALAQNLKSILPTYPILDILANRDTIALQLTKAMTVTFADYRTDEGAPVVFFSPRNEKEDEAAKDDEPVASVFISNVGFTEQFNAAIEAKQAELQKIELEQNVLAQVEIKAQQEIEKARGEAEANTLLAASLKDGNFVLQFKAIEALAPNIKVLLLDANNGLIPILGESLLSGTDDDE